MKWFLKCFDGIKFMFSGRARRKEYWMFQLFNFLIVLLFSFLFIMFILPWAAVNSSSGDIKELMGGIAVGGTFSGRPDNSTQFPQYMYVDWIRVYKKV